MSTPKMIKDLIRLRGMHQNFCDMCEHPLESWTADGVEELSSDRPLSRCRECGGPLNRDLMADPNPVRGNG